MEFFAELIAKLFKNFRIKNPVVGAVVLLLLSGLSYTAAQGTVYGLYVLPTWAQPVLTFVSLFLTAVSAPEVYPTLIKAAKTAAK